MILSNLEVQRALKEQRLFINPEPAPRLTSGLPKSPYNTHSVDLTLGDVIVVPSAIPADVDPSGAGLMQLLANNKKQYISTLEQPFVLKPGLFILAQTRETIGLPIPKDGQKCLGARIEGRSSLARLGLLVHFTAPTIHPGFTGTITLEIINHGPNRISLRPGIAIAQLIVEEVAGIPDFYPSQFQGQSTPEGARR
jgi:dCTP deaminase